MDRYREHRVRTSLGRSAAESPEPDDALRRRAAAVWSTGRGVMFFADQIEAMPREERAAIEAAARRLYGNGGNGNG